MLDLDDLKTVNDQAGHAQGDHLLQCFARALQETFGTDGQVFRQGGDEFTVLFVDRVTTPEQMRVSMEEVRQHMGRHGYPSVHASVGTASFPHDARSSSDLLRLADQRMLRDKAARRAVRNLRGERRPLRDPQLTAEMMWRALRATSALITTDGVMDSDSWQAFLQAAVTALPSAEAGSLYLLEGGSFTVCAQVGYSEALLGVSHPPEAMGRWYGLEKSWALGQARVLRGASSIRAAAHLPQEWAEPGGNREARQHLEDLQHLQSTLCVPVLISGVVVAVINLDNLRSEDAFEPYELDIAEEFGRQVAAILASHDRRLREADRTQELEVLAHANAALSLIQDPKDLERMLVDEVKALFRTEHAVFARYEPEEHALHLVARSGLDETFPQQVSSEGQGVSWDAITSGQVLRVARLDQDPRAHTPGVHPDDTLLAAPLISPPKTPIGVLLVVRPHRQPFSALDERLLGALASAGVTAFERLRVTAEEQRRSDELRVLAELASNVGLADDVGAVARECLALSRSFLGADLALFTCPERSLDVSIDAEPEGGSVPEARKIEGANSRIDVPVLERGRVVGRVSLVWLRPLRALPRSAQALANRSAELIGRVLDREAHLADIKATREGALLALGLSLELRDFETAGHTERVVTLSLRIGEALGLSSEALEHLRVGAYLHDLGKLAIPDAILLKPGKLDPDEWHQMQRHSVIGDELVSRIPTVPQEARSVVRHHHERWDGSGYPDRLAGTAIPLGARIFSVADVYDALTSARPYKPAWTAEAAAEELRQQAGRQFDPDVVEAALFVLTCSDSEPSDAVNLGGSTGPESA